MKNFLHRRLVSERGIALVMTLAILVMVTMLVVAFAVSMRVESMGAKNFNTMIQARQLAQGAVDQAVGQIRSATPFGGTWMTMPGAIYWRNGAWTNVQLYTSNIVNSGTIDLNTGYWITGSNTTYSSQQIFVGWSNLAVVVSGTTTQYSRYAYWVDDESAKVNVNVAGTRSADPNGQTMAAIDLTALFSSADQQAITNFVATVRPFDTLDCLQQTNSISQLDEYTNQFYMTTVSTSPDYTPWGTKRLNLSNIVATASSPQAAVAVVASALSDINLTNFFGVNQTFSNKYPSVQQIAANIVDYINTNNIPTDSGSGWNDTTTPAYLGLKQTPYLNELVISNTIVITTNPPAPAGGALLSFTNKTVTEVWYMYPSSSWSPPAGTEIYLTNQPVIAVVNNNSTNYVSPPNQGTISAPTLMGLTNGGIAYSVFSSAATPLTTTIADTNQYVDITLLPSTVKAIYRVNGGAGGWNRIDYALIPLTNYTMRLDLRTLLTAANNHTSTTNFNWITACNDPRVKPISYNWNPVGVGAVYGTGTLGGFNNGTVFYGHTNAITVPLGVVQFVSDGDQSCHTNTTAPVVRQRGTMYPGELAFIHTGVPWRTLWLQPQFSTELMPANSVNLIPDWAVLDLFSATDSTNIVGRINVNAMPTNGATLYPIQARNKPLQALLTNTTATATGINNLYSGWPLSNVTYALFPALSTNVTAFIGEVCEIKNLNVGGTKLANETPIRDIANLITTRGNDFTIWAIAQSLQVIPAGATIYTNVTGEAKIQAIVERDDSSGSVKFRTRYFRYSTQ